MLSISELRPKSGIEYLILNSVYVSLSCEDDSPDYQYDRTFIFDVRDYLDGILDGMSLIPKIKEIGSKYIQNNKIKNHKSLLESINKPDDEWNSALIGVTPKISRMLNSNY